MSVKYIDLRKQRHKEQIKELEKRKKVNAKIAQKMHNYEHNIETEDLEEKDDRSNYERNEDLNYIRQQIGAKLNKLFANDVDEVNTFMEFINQSQISIQDFNAVFPELLKNSDPNTNTALYSIPKFQQLLDNDYGNTKQTSLMKDIYNLILKVYESGTTNMTEKEADELIDRAEFYNQSPTSEISEKATDIMDSNESKEEKVIELDKLYETPMRQKTLDEDWTQVESKSSRRKKKKEQKQQEDDEKFSPKKAVRSEMYPPFKSIDLANINKKELQKIAEDYGLTKTGNKNAIIERLMTLNPKK